MAATRRKYSREFKVEAVRMITEKGLPVTQVARDLGIDLSAAGTADPQARIPPLEVPPPASVRLGGMPLDFEGVA